MKTAYVRARIEPKLKESVESLFAQLGMSSSEAISLFYRQCELNRGLPFPVRLPEPNKETIAAMEATDKGEGLTRAKDAEDMFGRLGI
ncbi:type II toxin-antitoxin system RelB/DinJ family antitoxin [Azotosporobacter soli]|uniref:type II toxin-antitoxin system RelB/DinJ family antitoxin n=1 Tax=Azotosporobacter soli TaxID=3055040 RepID=UPI0031FF077B